MPIGLQSIKDNAGKVGGPLELDATKYFTGHGLTYSITSVMHPMGTECRVAATGATVARDAAGLCPDSGDGGANIDWAMRTVPTIKMVDVSEGMVTITLSPDAQYGASMATLRATDENGLWREQDFQVMRNKKPSAADSVTVNVGTTSRQYKVVMFSELFTDQKYDYFTVAKLFNTEETVADAMVDDLLGNVTFTQMKAGETTITLSATDAAGESSSNAVAVKVWKGPTLKAGRPEEIILDVGLLTGADTAEKQSTIALGDFYTAAPLTGADGADDPAAGAVTRTEFKSSKTAVATVGAAPTDDSLAVTLKSAGSTTITGTVTQETGPTADRFNQKVTIEFTLTVR